MGDHDLDGRVADEGECFAPRQLLNFALVQGPGPIPQPAIPCLPSITARLALALAMVRVRISDPTTGRDGLLEANHDFAGATAREKVRHPVTRFPRSQTPMTPGRRRPDQLWWAQSPRSC